ncbi:MAG: histidine--tRNA ligase [Anaerolineaceae bacterium]
MNKLVKSVKGTRDFYPEEMALRRWLIGKIQQTSEAFGYQEYDGPCIETLDLYAAKSGEELVKEQAFVFSDRSGENIALRPELTPTLARMVAAKQNELTFPLRWWSFGPFWRYERPQRGRSREFFQWNIDLIGAESVLADAELVAVAATFLKNVGLTDRQVQILVNNRQLVDTALSRIGIDQAQKPSILKMIDRIDKQPSEVWDENVLGLGLTQSQLQKLKELLADQELWQESVELSEFFQAVEWLGVSAYVSYDPKIIRGLDYYTGTVFEARDTAGNFRAILGGGHYSNLVADVGGKPLPGVGFAMGDVVIQLMLEAHDLLPWQTGDQDQVFVTIFDEATRAVSCQVAAQLRSAGFKVITYPEVDKLAKQLKYADRIGAKAALVIGPDELVRDEVVVKNLRTREQEVVPQKELESKLRSLLAQE